MTWDAVYLPLGRLLLVGDPVPAPLRAVADGPGDWAAAASSARYDLHAKRTEGGVYSERDNQHCLGMGLFERGDDDAVCNDATQPHLLTTCVTTSRPASVMVLATSSDTASVNNSSATDSAAEASTSSRSTWHHGRTTAQVQSFACTLSNRSLPSIRIDRMVGTVVPVG